MIKETTLTGTPEEIRARIRKVAGEAPEITDFATHVIQELR
jgi:hypothetical protein